MKKFKNLVIGGIQNKIFNLVLITVVLMIITFASVAVYQYRTLGSLFNDTRTKQEEAVTSISSQTMDSVIDSSLSTTTDLQAVISDDVFEELSREVNFLADYAENLAADPDSYKDASVSRPDKALDGTVSVQVMTEPGIDIESEESKRVIRLFGNMSDVLKGVSENMDVNSCYIATPEGIMIAADTFSGSRIDPDGEYITIEASKRSWYTGAVEAKDVFFSDVMTDTFNGRVTIVCSKPVYYPDGNLAGVIGIDLYLDSIAEAVESYKSDASFIYIVNGQGHIIFSPKTEGTFMVRMENEATDLRESDNPALASFIADSLADKTDIHEIEADGRTWYMSGAPMPTVGWAVITAVDKAMTDEPTLMMSKQLEDLSEEASAGFFESLAMSRRTTLVMLLIVLSLTLALGLYTADRIVRPLNNFTERIRSLGGDDLEFKMADEYKTGDEIEVLAHSFADLSRKTLQYVNEVTRVTAEKEHIEAELDMAKAIQASQLPSFFPAYPERKEFDIYATMKPAKHVGGDFYDFFLVDDDHMALVMADVAGKGVPAALFMMVARILIKNRLSTGEAPSDVLYNVNNQLLESNEAGMFVTVWMAVIEISTGKGIAVNAGHEHPALKHKGGKYELVVYRHSPAVASFEDLTFTEHEFKLEPGDSVFVYTDGVAEATDIEEQLFGTERLLEALNSDPDADAEKTINNVLDAIEDFAAGEEQFDDITMLAFEYRG